MQKYDVNILKLKENANDIIKLSSELNSIFSNIFTDIESLTIKNIWLGNSALDFVRKAKLEREQYIKLKDTIYEEGKYIYDYALEIEQKMHYFNDNPVTVHYDCLRMQNNVFPNIETIKNKLSSTLNYANSISIPSGFSQAKSLNNIFHTIQDINDSVRSVGNDLTKFDYDIKKLNDDFIMNIKGASIFDMLYRDTMI